MTAMTVTANSGAGSNQDIALSVKVLTGAAARASQSGATKTATVSFGTAINASITPGSTGSWIYGAMMMQSSTATWTAEAGTTIQQTVDDTSPNTLMGAFRSTSTTAGGTPTTQGSTAPANGTAVLAMAEILASGTLAEDASAPAAVSSLTAASITTASFAPASGALLVAVASCGGVAGSALTIAISDSLSSTWTTLAIENPTGDGCTIIAVADGPITTPVSGSDSGTGTDVATVTVAGADSGTGTDSGSVHASVPGADSGTGTDSATVAVLVPGADSGTGTDTASVSVATQVSGADSGTGTDSAARNVAGQGLLMATFP